MNFHPLAVGLIVLSFGCSSVSYTPAHPPLTGAQAIEPAPFASANVKVLAPDGGVSEGAIAISPVNPRVVLAAGIRGPGTPTILYYRSLDGGLTWSPGEALPLAIDRRTLIGHFDPVLAFDRKGVAYLAAIGMISDVNFTFVMYRSADNGARWTGVDVANGSGLVDKPWISIDENDKVYAIWFQLGLRVASSPDGVTWSTPVVTPSHGSPAIAAGPNGKVYMSYVKDFDGYYVERSSDGGKTFSAPLRVAGGVLPASERFRQFSAFHQIAVDRSPRATRGHVYMVTPAGANGRATWPSVINFQRSTDGGATWSAPLSLSAPVTLDRDSAVPALDVDPLTGEIVVAWLDRRDDPNNQRARLYAATSADGGVTFTAPAPFSDPFSVDGFIGHYNQVAIYNGKKLAIFSDGQGHLSVAHLGDGTTDPTPPAAKKRRSSRH